MAPLLLELSSLEAEPLEVLVSPSESEQESRLDTLITVRGEVEITTLWTGTSPVNASCCCCCPVCCCACGGCCCCFC